jgi:hypothetical protein
MQRKVNNSSLSVQPYVFKKKHKYAARHIRQDGVLFKEMNNKVFKDRLLRYGKEVKRVEIGIDDPNVLQLNLADYILHKYTLDGFAVYRRYHKERDVVHLRVLLASIKAPNIHNCDMYGLQCTSGSIQSEDNHAPEYIDRFVRTLHPEAIEQMEGAFISGAGVSGYYAAYRKYMQDGQPVSIDWSIFTTAYYRLRCVLNIEPYTLYRLDYDTYDLLGLPKWNMGGVLFGTCYNLNGEGAGKITYTNTVSREQLRDITIKRMLQLVKAFEDGKNTYDDFPKPLCATVKKSEVFTKGTDPNKLRIINAVSNIKVAWDMYFWKTYHEQMYDSKVVGIGHKWRNGGAYALYSYMEGDIRDKWTYVTLDISRLDKNMRENLIAFLAYDVMQYVPDTPLNKYIVRCLSVMTASRHLLWHGDPKCGYPHSIKFVQGSLSSGELCTSSMDTKCGLIISMSFDEYVYRKIELGVDMSFEYFGTLFMARFSEYSLGEWVEQFLIRKQRYGSDVHIYRPYAPMVDYGDDLFRAWLKKFDGLLNYKHMGKSWPLLLMWFMRTFFKLSAKEEEVDVYAWNDEEESEPLITKVDKDNNIVKYGPKYLQRRFIKARVPTKDGRVLTRVLPWRQTDDYYAKATVRLQRSFDPPIYLSVLRGLKFDTMGTNRSAFCFLNDLESIHLKLYPESSHKLGKMLSDPKLVSEFNFLDRLKKVGFDDALLLGNRLTLNEVLAFFWYSDPEAVIRKFIIGQKF